MKILLIGQLPTEIGGNYTTGAANVVYELSKKSNLDLVYYTYGTNLRSAKAKKASRFPLQYIGYKIQPIGMLINAFLHPISTFKHWKHYRQADHQSVLRYAFYEYNIRNAIKAVKPDIIHVNSIDNVSPVRFALGSKKIPILLTCHGIFYQGDEKDIVNRDRYLNNIGLVDAFSGLTKESLDEYEEILGIDRKRVAIIPNGVDCSKFYFSKIERERVRKEFGIPEDCKVFITVASIQERKGQLKFLKLLSKLPLENYRYWMVGKGLDEDAINEFVKENNLQKKVSLLGYKSAHELYKYYSAADIYAHPSWKEGQALSELEAYATGLPTIVNKAITRTIASDINSENYYVLDFSNINVKTLIAWIDRASKERVSRNTFDWNVIVDLYHSLYKKIISTYR